ncbi:MAG: NAD-dependent protein deacylase [Holophagales bacterium]|jgi:NAD-dependent deacetylase|nr:NAD-dependent protein deacylase [Holophagales bacterium]
MTVSKPGLVILTGAGISAESGIRTFRSSNGLWEEHRIEDVATPMGFKRDPHLVQRFYNERRKQLSQTLPNTAHHALVELERAWPGSFLLVTQNVDDLHDRAGSQSMLHMHGELLKVRCVSCDTVSRWETDVLPDSQCPACKAADKLRPHIVWFGETPLDMEIIYRSLETCDYFAAIGTSGHVYPAAGFVQCVGSDCHTTEINLEPSVVNSAFKECRHGPATETVPAWVREMLSRR